MASLLLLDISVVRFWILVPHFVTESLLRDILFACFSFLSWDMPVRGLLSPEAMDKLSVVKVAFLWLLA